jgi:hypothetical protein
MRHILSGIKQQPEGVNVSYGPRIPTKADKSISRLPLTCHLYRLTRALRVNGWRRRRTSSPPTCGSKTMRPKITLRHRIFLIVGALAAINVMGASVMVWYTYRIQYVLSSIIEQNLASYQSAANLEVALVNQKGFVTYFFPGRQPRMVAAAGRTPPDIPRAPGGSQNPYRRPAPAKACWRTSKHEYEQYVAVKDQVIAHYQANRHDQGVQLHPTVRTALLRPDEHLRRVQGDAFRTHDRGPA